MPGAADFGALHSPSPARVGVPSTFLSGVYGARLRVVGSSQVTLRHLIDLEDVPGPFHAHVAEYLRGHPEGGIDIVDGPVTDVMPELRGQTPRGWPAGSTWAQVPGLLDTETRRLVISGHDRPRLSALHEFGHAVDFAGGLWSGSKEFTDLYDRLGALSPYRAQPGVAGRQETFADAFAAWAHHRHWSDDARALSIADTLDLSADKKHMSIALDRYFSTLQDSL
ncbi:anthrax toxin lethal factor-related metalloendopeptidase [Actinoallomurus iriomotensis]|uniref:Anthrax toxin lethal/endema factor N-/C-terminal domain-containing protein n=1 Tax=Actinoallomurus iriomotensis TaxID=478107 RepID=A0A9W6RMV1_9ACTN|nr:hypothetical protein [Actinoallomurus iriomotensis]GLY78573.1 hypothetical protein Airi01_068400 [Actinoallomurus iriomotensis]